MTALERLREIEREIEDIQRKLEDRELDHAERRTLQSRLAMLRQQRVSASIAAKREQYEKSLGSA